MHPTLRYPSTNDFFFFVCLSTKFVLRLKIKQTFFAVVIKKMLVNEFPFMETVRVAFFVDKIFFIYDDTANFMPNQEKILKVQ